MTICRSKEIPYGDKDQRGEYTLQPGDLVEFNIATDRRDKLQRGTNIEVVQETFKANMEERETVRIIETFTDPVSNTYCMGYVTY